jgi:hypothetical protein
MAAIKNKYLPRSAIKKEEKITPESLPEPKINDKIHNRDKEWERVKIALKKFYTKEIFDKWLSGLELKYSYETEVVMIVSSKFIRDWVKREYLSKIKEFWQGQGAEIKKVVIISEELKQ